MVGRSPSNYKLFCHTTFRTLLGRAAQQSEFEVSQLIFDYVMALKMSVKYLKATIFYTQKSVKFRSVIILLWECQLFLGFWHSNRNLFDSQASHLLNDLFQHNETSFQLQQLSLATSVCKTDNLTHQPHQSGSSLVSKKHWKLMANHGHRYSLSGGFLIC